MIVKTLTKDGQISFKTKENDRMFLSFGANVGGGTIDVKIDTGGELVSYLSDVSADSSDSYFVGQSVNVVVVLSGSTNPNWNFGYAI